MDRNSSSAISLLLNKILDLFFPKKCLGCNKPDTYLCGACFNKIEVLSEIYKNQGHLDLLIAAASYKNPIVREMIKRFKYDYVKELTQSLGQLLIKKLENNCKLEIENCKLILVPIPLYKFRQRKRGFNQAELLAKEIAGHFNLELRTDILKRTISTEPQADIKDDEKRKENIKDVFKIHSSSLIRLRDANVILVDDVSTTNATLNEAARILKQNHANKVWGLVVARG